MINIPKTENHMALLERLRVSGKILIMQGQLAMMYFGTPLGWRLTPGLAYKAFLEHFHVHIADALPNAGHKAVVRLESEGAYEDCQVITMNVDGLHQVRQT